MVDLHCHVLPAVDDGPADDAAALELLRAQRAAGVDVVVATSHVDGAHVANDARRLRDATALLGGEARTAGIDVELVAGAEVALWRAIETSDEELAALSLGGSGWVLLEPPFGPAPGAEVASLVLRVRDRGHRILLAHPERCPAFQRDREALADLVAAGIRCSLTAGSFAGAFGTQVRRVAVELLDRELAHNVASDAHRASGARAPGLAATLDGAGFGPLTEWLCEAVPRAILAGDPLPSRPPFERGRRHRWRRGR